MTNVDFGGLCSPNYHEIRSQLKPKFPTFFDFFTENRWELLIFLIKLALIEDGEDLTSNGIFSDDDYTSAYVIAKEDCITSCLPLIDIILKCLSNNNKVTYLAVDGQSIKKNTKVVEIYGKTKEILKAERIILNFLGHTFGVATYTKKYVDKLRGSKIKVLDTRKTIPGMRYIDKYSVLMGGGSNHRMDLSQMLMIKDNHIDRAGSITKAVNLLLEKYKDKCPPIIVECRNIREVKEAASLNIKRILLDNMEPKEIEKCLEYIPKHIETEVSGGINIENISRFSNLKIDFISVGALTKSAPCIDLSMRIL